MKAAALTGGVRVSEEVEESGLDLTCHGETAYRLSTMTGDEESVYH
jgi:ammonia channel protein AmtB